MRRYFRSKIPVDLEKLLAEKQALADSKRVAGALNATSEWKSARQSNALKQVFELLKAMAGARERCMYCSDSHGTDIEHFRPKTPYPDRMFRWTNLLLGCSGCGRLKGDRFPLDAAARPLLIDPTDENPWDFLDFDPRTGNIVAKFDPSSNDWNLRGATTVEILRLDRREALAQGHLRCFREIRKLIESVLRPQPFDIHDLFDRLTSIDEYGLLHWCFSGPGRNETPFSSFREMHRDAWDLYVTKLSRTGDVSNTQSPRTANEPPAPTPEP